MYAAGLVYDDQHFVENRKQIDTTWTYSQASLVWHSSKISHRVHSLT